jgi:hypothetical protein
MRLARMLPFIVAASGCVSARWSLESPRTVSTLAVAPVATAGLADPKLAIARRASLVASLRARGYLVRDPAPGVPLLSLTLSGRGISDAQMHAPDDPRHNIENDLHYFFVAYHVDVTVHDGDGRLLAHGSADSDQDPAPALRVLELRLAGDLPPRAGASVARR